MRVELPLIASILLVGAFARADAIYLQGGRVIEGTATVEGDKVTVELESGRMSFERSEVVRIEKATAPLDEVDQREKKLAKDDIAGTLELANYCSQHGLLNRERALLERVIARQPDHAEARRRLGYVREGEKWVLRSEQLRKEREAQAQHDRENSLVRQRQQLQLEEAQLQRDRAQAALQAERERSTPQPAYGTYYTPVVVGGSWGYGWNNGYAHHGRALSPPVNHGGNFINGAQSPQSAWGEAYRTAYGHAPPR